MNKPVAILMAIACFLGGFILGALFFPAKGGTVIGSDNEISPSRKGVVIGCKNRMVEKNIGEN